MNGAEVRFYIQPWYNFILISSILTLGLGGAVALNPKNDWLNLLIFFTAFICGFLLAEILTKSKVTITILDEELIIRQASHPLKKQSTKIISLKHLRGFELSEAISRNDLSLVLYQKDFKAYRYLISSKNNIDQIQNFLSSYIDLLTPQTNPLYKGFKQAFNYAFKVLFKFLIFSLLSWVCLFYICNYFIGLQLGFNSIILSSLFVSSCVWIFITKKTLNKNYFRYGASSILSMLFPFVTVLLAIATFLQVNKTNTKAVKINSPDEIFNHRNTDYFYINQVKIDNLKSRTYYCKNSIPDKNKEISVNHFMQIPIQSSNTEFNKIFLRLDRVQKLNSVLPESEQSILINAYNKQVKNNSQELLKQKPIFYKVQLSKIKNIQLAILKPLYEEISIHHQKNYSFLIFLSISIVLFLLIGTFAIAINR